MPEGDHDKLPSLPKFIDGWQLGKPDMVVKMSEPFPVPDEGRDIYRSFVIPLDLPEGKWLKAIEFRPDARSVVHHCLFFYDTTGEARRLDKSDPRPGFRRMRQQGRGIGPQAVGLLEVNLKSCRKIWLTICLKKPISCYPCTIIHLANQNETSRVLAYILQIKNPAHPSPEFNYPLPLGP